MSTQHTLTAPKLPVKYSHSPTPWIQVLLHPDCILGKGQRSDESFRIVTDCELMDKAEAMARAQANAAFIVRAANAHDDLVEALKLLLYGAERAVKAGLVQPQVNGGIILARSALARATEGATHE